MSWIDIWTGVLIVWTGLLVAWAEMLGQRHLRLRWIIEHEVRRRMRRRQPRRTQPSHVSVRASNAPRTMVADEVEQWLRDRAR